MHLYYKNQVKYCQLKSCMEFFSCSLRSIDFIFPTWNEISLRLGINSKKEAKVGTSLQALVLIIYSYYGKNLIRKELTKHIQPEEDVSF